MDAKIGMNMKHNDHFNGIHNTSCSSVSPLLSLGLNLMCQLARQLQPCDNEVNQEATQVAINNRCGHKPDHVQKPKMGTPTGSVCPEVGVPSLCTVRDV